MYKILFIISLIFFLNNCSVDTKTGIWENKNLFKLDEKIADLKFGNDLSYDEFKKNTIEYGKLSGYPKLD